MIKYCNTCRLRDKTKKVCLLFGIPMEDTDYCSKHADVIIPCDICGQPLLGSTYVEYDDNIHNKKEQENISKQWINELQYEILRPYGKEQYILVERSELPAEVAFRLDVCPVAGEDVHHCYRTTLD